MTQTILLSLAVYFMVLSDLMYRVTSARLDLIDALKVAELQSRLDCRIRIINRVTVWPLSKANHV